MNQFLIPASAAILAAILTILGNTYIQNLNYKRDYYKKLLDKRLEAYEKIDGIVNRLGIMAPFPDGVCSFVFTSFENYMQLYDDIILSLSHGQWVDEETIYIIEELNVFLINKVDNLLDDNKDKNKQLITIGIEIREDMKVFRRRIMASAREDFKTMHNVQRYLNRKKPYRMGFQLELKPENFRKS